MATIADVTSIPLSQDAVIDALLDDGPAWNYLTDSSGNALGVITYTFGIEGGAYNGAAVTRVAAFNADQIAAAEAALAYVSSVTGIAFAYTGSAADAHLSFQCGNITASASTSGLCAWSYSYSYAGSNTVTAYNVDADIFLDNAEFAASNSNPTAGTEGYQILLHEIGHALGLKHPFEGSPIVPAGLDNTDHTIMSYTWTGGNKSSFRQLDLDALWWIYGGDGLRGTYGINSAAGPTLPGVTPARDITAPTVVSFDPEDESTGVAAGGSIAVTFSEPVAIGSGVIYLKDAQGNILETYDRLAPVPGALTVSGHVVTIDPTMTLAAGTTYRIEIPAGTIEDLAGNPYAGTDAYNFTTEAARRAGTEGADTFAAAAGNETFDGMGGTDAVEFDGARADHTIGRAASALSVTDNAGAGGTDTLLNIERLVFDDRRIAFDLQPEQSAAEALAFIAVLASNLIRVPEAVGRILPFFDAGHTLESLGQLAIDVGLVSALAGSGSNADLARLAYRNVVGAEADAAMVDILTGFMDGRSAGYSQAAFIGAVAGLELTQQRIGLSVLQETGIDYVI